MGTSSGFGGDIESQVLDGNSGENVVKTVKNGSRKTNIHTLSSNSRSANVLDISNGYSDISNGYSDMSDKKLQVITGENGKNNYF